MDNTINTFGEHLLSTLKKFDKTESYWTLKFNVPRAVLHTWYNNESMPDPDKLRKIWNNLKELDKKVYLEFLNIFDIALKDITPLSIYFKYKNLYEYLAEAYLDDLYYTLETANSKISSKDLVGFYKDLNDLILDSSFNLEKYKKKL